MRAVVCDRYGPPDVLRLAEVAKPVPKPDEVLVRVHATTVRFGDKRVVFPIPPRYTKQDVLFLRKLIAEGKYRAVIDRRCPLEDVIDATRYVETKQKTGNVVLTVAT